MENDDDKIPATGFSLPLASTSGLKGKQSVRATFKLSEGCIEAIGIVANQMGIKQKSLFDHLAEDINILESIAHDIKNTTLDMHNRVQKTFVISRRSLASLDEISKVFDAPRDALVELSIQRLLPIINSEVKSAQNLTDSKPVISFHYVRSAKFEDIKFEL